MTSYPSRPWATYETFIRQIGERRKVTEDIAFLVALGLVSPDQQLTDLGQEYFKLRFIRRDQDAAVGVIAQALLGYVPAEALCQMLEGVPGADKETAESVLRNQGLAEGLTDRSLGSLLTLMNHAPLIRYTRGRLEVLVKPSHEASPPSSIFVSRTTPFGNKVWLRRVLEECLDFVYWFDKHFLPVAFEPLWEAADGNRISEIKILSLKLEGNSGRKALRQYQDLQQELVSRRVSLEWRFIDSQLVRDTHDRWIIGASSARNVPDVGTIFSGNHSEFNKSDQADELNGIFEGYWTAGVPVI